MGDLNSKRGRIQGSSSVGNGEVEIVALVPTSEVLRYAIDLRSITGGRGRFTLTHSHYDPVPAHLADKIAPRPRRRRCERRASPSRPVERPSVGPVLGVRLGVLAEHRRRRRRRPRRARAATAARRRCRAGCATTVVTAGRATRAGRTRARRGSRRRGSRPRARRSGRPSRCQRGDEVVRRRRATSRPPATERARRCPLASPATSDAAPSDGRVDRAGDAPAADVREEVGPDVRGDVEIFGERVLGGVGELVARRLAHSAPTLRAGPARSEPVARLRQRLGEHARLGDASS